MRKPENHHGSAVGILLLLLALSGCSEPSHPRPEIRRLAVGFVPSQSVDKLRPWKAPASGGRPLLMGGGRSKHERRIRCIFARDQWTYVREHLWRAPAPLASLSLERAHQPRLRAGQQPIAPLKFPPLRLPTEGAVDPEFLEAVVASAEEPSFLVTGGFVYLALPAGGEPPASVEWNEGFSLGEIENDTWRVPAGAVVADGIPVLPGDAEEIVIDLAPRSALRFGTLALGAAGPPDGPLARFRVLLDGEPILEHEQAVRTSLVPVEHVVLLPPASRRQTRLRFEVEGPACFSAFLTPVLTPAPVDGEVDVTARPPDIVLLLADTYRADNLAAWGGDPGIAPHLNELAAGSRRYLNAHCPATWTLPSHASLFTGLYPRQLGVVTRSHSLSQDVHTLAEHLLAAGYRTVAVTERGFVSRKFGFSQGFEWFEEHAPTPIDRAIERTVARTLERSAIDDGRPLFLFVHTYRAHNPYTVSDETRARLPAYDVDRDFQDLATELVLCEGEPVRGEPFTGRRRELAGILERLYRGASADLDQSLGELLAGLEEQSRIGAADVLLFTSDHGESFGEHGVFGHMQGVWREESLVPLLIRGPGVSPGEVQSPVGLVSVPRTICALAGIEPHPEWLGRDLIAGPPISAPLATYQCGPRPSPADLALFDGSRKIILPDAPGAEPDVRHAYRLDADALEERDEREQAWTRELLQTWSSTLEALQTPRINAHEVELSPEVEQQLRALGYAGD